MTNLNANINVMAKAVSIAGDTLLRDFEEIIRLQSSIEGAGKLTQKALQRADNAIIYELTSARPHYSLESTLSSPIIGKDPTRKWLVYAVSGVDNFARGNPNWVISVGLLFKGEIQLAVINQPCFNEIYKGVKGNGAYSRQMKLRVAPINQVSSFSVAIDFDSCKSLSIPPLLNTIFSNFRAIRTSGSASLDLLNLSAGKIDGFIGFQCDPIEILPAQLLLTEAGGLVHTFPNQNNNDYHGLIAAGYHKFDEFKQAALEFTTI